MPDVELARQVYRVAAEARKFLEPRWPALQEALGGGAESQSEGTCIPTCVFVTSVLNERGFDAVARHGRADENKGFRMAGGWCDHGWVEVGGMILDPTADQFGGKPIQVLPANHLDYKSANAPPLLEGVKKAFFEQWREDWAQQFAPAPRVAAPLPRAAAKPAAAPYAP